MRILVDTNILIPHCFPTLKACKGSPLYCRHHEMVLCDRNLYELRNVLKRKAPHALPDAEVLLAELSYELIPATYHAEKLIIEQVNTEKEVQKKQQEKKRRKRVHYGSCRGPCFGLSDYP